MYKKTAQEMMEFIRRSPSCYHVVENARRLLLDASWQELCEKDIWEPKAGQGYFVTRNGSSIIAFRLPLQPPAGVMIAAAHTDSPTFRVKSRPVVENSRYVKLNVEPYGGGIYRGWLDRPLSVAGRAVVRTPAGAAVRLVQIDKDLLVIPSVAIHMDRQVNEGGKLNPQVDMLPLLGQTGADFEALVAEAAGVEKKDLLGGDLFLYPRQPGWVWGAQEEFISSPRLDDLQCAWSALTALAAAQPAEKTLQLCALFDNEEVGSSTKQGADSAFLETVLERVCEALGLSTQQKAVMLANGLMVSADNGHAIHPAHPELSDGENYPVMNGGVVIKYSANQKYTTDAVSAGLFGLICEKAGVPVQVFHNRSDMPGGSTLGNLSNRHVSLDTVDIGLAQLAMHSVCETAGVKDTLWLQMALKAFYSAAACRLPDGSWQLD